jgi:hypothetical protein
MTVHFQCLAGLAQGRMPPIALCEHASTVLNIGNGAKMACLKSIAILVTIAQSGSLHHPVGFMPMLASPSPTCHLPLPSNGTAWIRMEVLGLFYYNLFCFSKV